MEDIRVHNNSFECSVTSDVAVFGFDENRLKILLTKRTVGELKDQWLLPGGVMGETETVEQCANKVLYMLTGIDNIHIRQVNCYSDIHRHQLKRVVTVLFYALIRPENHPLDKNLNVTEIRWFSLDELPKKFGFDHANLIRDAHKLLKQNLKTSLIFGELLSETFTLNELQTLYESILGERLDRRNFRKKIFQMDVLESTNTVKKGVKGGPYLYRKKTPQGSDSSISKK